MAHQYPNQHHHFHQQQQPPPPLYPPHPPHHGNVSAFDYAGHPPMGSSAVAPSPSFVASPLQPQGHPPPPPPPTTAPAATGAAAGPSKGVPTAPSSPSHACPSCGVDQQRLALMQESVALEQQLLREDKRNFKRRLQAAKATARKTMVHAENQLLLVDRQKKECEQKLRDSQEQIQTYKLQLKDVQQQLNEMVTRRQEELERRLFRGKEQEPSDEEVSRQTDTTTEDGIALGKIEELNQQLEEKQSIIDGYEMQMLEMERELEMLRQGEDMPSDDDICINCQRMQARLERIEQDQKRQTELLQKQHQYQLVQVQQQVALAQHEAASLEETKKDLEEALRHQIETKRQLEADNSSLLEKLLAQQRLDGPREDPDLNRHTDNNTMASGNETVLTAATEADTIVSAAALSPTPKFSQDIEDVDDEVDEISLGEDESDSAIRLSTIPEVSDSSPNLPIRCLSAHSPTNTFLVFDKEYHGDNLVGMYTGYMTVDADMNRNIPHGLGTLRLDDGAIMDGIWEFGLLHGDGVLATIDGDVFHGGWLQGKKHGQGTLVFSDGRVYRGQFEDDNRQGQGYLTWPYGAYYQGEWSSDKRNGSGTYKYADGRYYTGMYQDDRPHGYGVLKSRNGDIIYDGQWELGEFLGSGNN